MAETTVKPHWRDLPKGKYLVEVRSDEGYRVIGWSLYYRSVPRITKTGRTIGRNAFIHSVRLAPGLPQAALDTATVDPFSAQAVRAALEEFLEDPNYWRAQFGKHEGSCGVCGRPLNDPQSRDRGIGPDCAVELGIA